MEKLKWGLIGCGDIAEKRVAPALRDLPNCELVAVSRARFELAEAFAKRFKAKRWCRDWRELTADKEVDAVYVATPVRLHAEQAIAAAEAGKHVLAEKPMAMNTNECDRMIAACRANNVRLGVAYYRRFYPVIGRIKEVIDSGEIGQTVVAQINAFEWFDPPPGHPRCWLIDKEQAGGGPMFDFGCHRIELLRHLFGDVARVRGLVSDRFFRREVEDTGVAVLQFEQGTCGTLTVTHAAAEPQDTLSVFGNKGSIHVPVLNQGEIKIITDRGERVETHPPHPNLHQPLIDDFAQAVLARREPTVDGAVGREVARIEQQIYDISTA